MKQWEKRLKEAQGELGDTVRNAIASPLIGASFAKLPKLEQDDTLAHIQAEQHRIFQANSQLVGKLPKWILPYMLFGITTHYLIEATTKEGEEE